MKMNNSCTRVPMESLLPADHQPKKALRKQVERKIICYFLEWSGTITFLYLGRGLPLSDSTNLLLVHAYNSSPYPVAEEENFVLRERTFYESLTRRMESWN